jgi:hypothetical protein
LDLAIGLMVWNWAARIPELWESHSADLILENGHETAQNRFAEIKPSKVFNVTQIFETCTYDICASQL